MSVDLVVLPQTLNNLYARDRVGGELWVELASDALAPPATTEREVWEIAAAGATVDPGETVTVAGVVFTAEPQPVSATDFLSGTAAVALSSLAIAIDTNAALAAISAVYNGTEVVVTALVPGTAGAFTLSSSTDFTATLVQPGADGNDGDTQALDGYGVYVEVIRDLQGVERPIRLEQGYQASNAYRFEISPYLRSLPPFELPPVPAPPALLPAPTYVLAYGERLQPEGSDAPYYSRSGATPPRHVSFGATPYQQTPPDGDQWATLPVYPTTVLAEPVELGKLRRRVASAPEYVYWWVIPALVPSATAWRVYADVYDSYGYAYDSGTLMVPTPTAAGYVRIDASPAALGMTAAVADAYSYRVELQYYNGSTWLAYSEQSSYQLDTQYTPERYVSLRWLGRAGVYECFTFDGSTIEVADNAATVYDQQQVVVEGWQRDKTPSPTLATEGAVALRLTSGWVDARHYAYLRDLVGSVRCDVLVNVAALAEALGVPGYTSPQWLAMRITASEWERDTTAGLFSLSLTVRPAADRVYARQ